MILKLLYYLSIYNRMSNLVKKKLFGIFVFEINMYEIFVY